MLDPRRFPWLDQLTFTRDVPIAGDRTEFYNGANRGEYVVVRRGVYMRTDHWEALSREQQHRVRIYAAVEYAKTDPVVSHASAACVWGLPWLTQFPRALHVLGSGASGGRSTTATVRHEAGTQGEIVWIDGIRVTSLARTVVDVACTESFAQAVAVADAALRRTEHPVADLPTTSLAMDDLLEELAKVSTTHGSAKARRAVEFANGAAASAGESISRVAIFLAGLPAPELQAPLRGASGRLWHVDFWWPKYNLIGEFDGYAKYVDDKYLNGSTPGEAVYEEKLREDDLRAPGRGFSRWGWKIASEVPSLRNHLIAAGLR